MCIACFEREAGDEYDKKRREKVDDVLIRCCGSRTGHGVERGISGIIATLAERYDRVAAQAAGVAVVAVVMLATVASVPFLAAGWALRLCGGCCRRGRP